MLQLLGLGSYLSLLALLQLIWPANAQQIPALVLVAGTAILYYSPRWGLYTCILSLAASFDLIYATGFYCLPAYALACLLPLWLSPYRQAQDAPIRGWLRPLLILQAVLISFEMGMILLSLPSAGWHSLAAALQSWPYFWSLSMLSALWLWPLSHTLVHLLHYQALSWRDEVRKGRLG